VLEVFYAGVLVVVSLLIASVSAYFVYRLLKSQR
jgi:hypothetical protein